MQNHWPSADEQPTPKAYLTVEVHLLPGDLADYERPTPKANLTIEIIPALPLTAAGTEPPAT